MRTSRQYEIDRALLRALVQTGSYLAQRPALFAVARLHVVGAPATETELIESFANHDTAGRLTSVQGETGAKYRLNDTGRAWAAENL